MSDWWTGVGFGFSIGCLFGNLLAYLQWWRRWHR